MSPESYALRISQMLEEQKQKAVRDALLTAQAAQLLQGEGFSVELTDLSYDWLIVPIQKEEVRRAYRAVGPLKVLYRNEGDGSVCLQSVPFPSVRVVFSTKGV